VTHHDTIPDFCAGTTIRSATNGAWSNPATWTPARVPGSNDVVLVSADAFMGAPVACTGIAGALNFVTGSNTRLWAGNGLVYAPGSLQVGTASAPVVPCALGYARCSIRDRLWTLAALSRWLTRRGLSVIDLRPDIVVAFLRPRTQRVRVHRGAAATLRLFLTYIEQLQDSRENPHRRRAPPFRALQAPADGLISASRTLARRSWRSAGALEHPTERIQLSRPRQAIERCGVTPAPDVRRSCLGHLHDSSCT
jgi:hypothetical protein